MGLFEKFTSEFVDIIEWLDQSNDTIAYRFERFQNEIKMGAKLTVRPGQKAVFVNEGQVADAFAPGMYTLTTQNMPILSTLKGFPYGFNSPFKAEVYFFNTKIFTNLKWGTSNPIAVNVPDLGGTVRIRAHGTYSMRVQDPVRLLQDIVSTDGLFQTDEISDQIRNMLVSSFATWLGQSGLNFADFAANYRASGDTIRASLQSDIEEFGITLPHFLIENISLPPEVEQALDRRASINVLGNMQAYTQYQAANAIEASAENPSGGNQAVDLGVGLAMGQQIVNAMQGQAATAAPTPAPAAAPAASAPPPPMPTQTQWFITREGQNFGPFATNQLLANGLTAQSYVWCNGMSGWQQAVNLPELAPLLTAPPPPMPQ
ncbi:MAG: SPFH domain-containing protein [Cyanobacteria bacterium P01_D01_bin.6]